MNAEHRERTGAERRRISPVGVLVVIALVLFVTILALESNEAKGKSPVQQVEEIATQPAAATEAYATPETPIGRLTVFAKMHSLPLSDWPTALVDLLEKHPEAESYVMNYPFYKDVEQPIDLSNCLGKDEVPLLIQWDSRWGYTQYSGELMGLSGCGPTSLSMVLIHLLQDARYTPRYVADFSEANGYYTTGMGSNWTLIYEGGEKLGLDVESIYIDEDTVKEQLKAGNPIICIMGPGDFTSSGHFIVMVGVENGMIRINDCNSRVRSEKLWKFSDIEDQIEGMWVCTLPKAEATSPTDTNNNSAHQS